MIRTLNVSGAVKHTKFHVKRDRKYVLFNHLRLSFLKGLGKVQLSRLVSRFTGLPVLYGTLRGTVLRNGERLDLGVLSYRVITTAGLEFLTDALMDGSEDFTDFSYHACGTDNTAEAVGDTALYAETTNPTRVTGTKEQNTSTTIDFTATQAFVSSLSIVEHGLFSSASAGTLWDRSVFATITVGNGDQIQWVYTLTLST